jgi:actin-related protein
MNIPNIKQRIYAELNELNNENFSININTPPYPQYLSFIGRCKIANSSFIKELIISKKDYEENGPNPRR